LRHIVVIVVFSILLVPSVTSASTYIAVDVPELQDSVVLLADLSEQSNLALVLGQGHGVAMFADNTIIPLIDGISGRVSALASGDMNGDLKNDLVVGTDSGGALYTYVERNGIWERHGQPQYLWDTIRHLESHDLNNDGWSDIVVVTGKGEAQILLSSEGSLYPAWRSKPGENVVGLDVLDFDQDGYPELVYAFESGYIGLLRLEGQEFSTFWENYPWGSVESLVVLPHQSSPEWLVITSQKMVYGWRFRNGEVVSSRIFEGNELGEHLFYFPGDGLLSLSQKTGVSLFELHSTSVSELWRVPGLFGNRAFRYQEDIYFRDRNGTYYKIVQGNASWRVFLHNQEITDEVMVLDHDGELFFRLPDLAERLGITSIPDNGWYYSVDGHDVIFDPERYAVYYDSIVIPMQNPVLQVDGLPYVSAEVFPLLGWKVERDSSRRHVVFQKNWGWWF